MALMAILRLSSRFIASMLDFWTKNNIRSKLAKIATMVISKIVNPCFLFMPLL